MHTAICTACGKRNLAYIFGVKLQQIIGYLVIKPCTHFYYGLLYGDCDKYGESDLMIRSFQKDDLDKVMQIWLEANITAHSFIKNEYWLDNYIILKDIFPQAEIYIYEDIITQDIVGFIGLSNNYIEGIFVKEAFRSKGVGKALLDYAKQIKSHLSLRVYQKNIRAVSFYKREQFKIQSADIDNATNEQEFVMIWGR